MLMLKIFVLKILVLEIFVSKMLIYITQSSTQTKVLGWIGKILSVNQRSGYVLIPYNYKE